MLIILSSLISAYICIFKIIFTIINQTVIYNFIFKFHQQLLQCNSHSWSCIYILYLNGKPYRNIFSKSCAVPALFKNLLLRFYWIRMFLMPKVYNIITEIEVPGLTFILRNALYSRYDKCSANSIGSRWLKTRETFLLCLLGLTEILLIQSNVGLK